MFEITKDRLDQYLAIESMYREINKKKVSSEIAPNTDFETQK
jgi:hypothetical protein